jgi:hypothetical protein
MFLWVSYNWSDDHKLRSGYGECVLSNTRAPKTMAEIETIRGLITIKGSKKPTVVLVNWKELEG